MQSVVLTELGIIITRDQEIVERFPFENPARDYVSAKNGDGLDRLARYIESSGDDFKVDRASLYDSLKMVSDNMQMMDEEEIESVRASKVEMLVDAGFAKSGKDAMSRLREFAVQLSSQRIAQESESPDLHIIQAIGALDEVDRDINVKGARVREWYGLHFPELENTVDGVNGYVRVVLAGRRDDLTPEAAREAGFQPEKVEMILAAASNSRGGDISGDNLAVVQELARQVLDLYGFRSRMEELVEDAMGAMAPNVTAVLGASVGARILSRAGSLKKLAMMPSSTIQILGAEKALFRSMKSGSQPPKHGLLFQHPMVHAAPRWQRGRIARAIAAKAAIASRVDMHSPELNETLLEKLNVKIKEINKRTEPGWQGAAGAESQDHPETDDAPQDAGSMPKGGRKGGKRMAGRDKRRVGRRDARGEDERPGRGGPQGRGGPKRRGDARGEDERPPWFTGQSRSKNRTRLNAQSRDEQWQQVPKRKRSETGDDDKARYSRKKTERESGSSDGGRYGAPRQKRARGEEKRPPKSGVKKRGERRTGRRFDRE